MYFHGPKHHKHSIHHHHHHHRRHHHIIIITGQRCLVLLRQRVVAWIDVAAVVVAWFVVVDVALHIARQWPCTIKVWTAIIQQIGKGSHYHN
jgi:type IV secretory pathway TrbD component